MCIQTCPESLKSIGEGLSVEPDPPPSAQGRGGRGGSHRGLLTEFSIQRHDQTAVTEIHHRIALVKLHISTIAMPSTDFRVEHGRKNDEICPKMAIFDFFAKKSIFLVSPFGFDLSVRYFVE